MTALTKQHECQRTEFGEALMSQLAERMIVIVCFAATGLGLGGCARVSAQGGPQPLAATTLLALVAGNALPDNVVYQIKGNGLAFRPDDDYRSLLKTAGADSSLLAALEGAKLASQDAPTAHGGKDLLQHIANAGAFLRNKQTDQAETEMTTALSGTFNGPARGFVIAEILRQQDKFEQAEEVYGEALEQDPNFPEVHTKLSYIFYKLQDPESGLREAKAALSQTPQNPEAHKNAGLALDAMHKFKASEDEYNEALREKPVYPSVEYDLGILYNDQGSWDQAVAHYQKAIALDPTNADASYNLGLMYERKHDYESAVRAYRNAKQLDPKKFEARQNLGHALIILNRYPEAVQEFREMEAIFPNSSMCRDGSGTALFGTWDFAGAEKEWLTAEQLDPSDARPHLGIGEIREQQKKYDEALKEYRRAQEMDSSLSDPWKGAGRVLIAQKDYEHAIEELKQGEAMRPDSAEIHDLLAQALAGTGKYGAAIDEFKASLELAPKQVQVMLRLAAAYEKKGDWPSSLNEYHEASTSDAGVDWRGKVTRLDELDPDKEYGAAQRRWNDHIAALKAAGKSSEAASLETQLKATQAAPTLSQQLDEALQAGAKANKERHFEEALADYKHAVELAEKIQPQDARLLSALDFLGLESVGIDPAAAQAAFEREFEEANKLYGPKSLAAAAALQSLGNVAMVRHDYPSAEKFFFQAVDINEKVFGESSDKVADSLLLPGQMYVVRKEYSKAEPYLQRAVHIDEALYGPEAIDMARSLGSLCYLYQQWNKPDQSDACNRKLLTVLEKQYGANSPVIVSVLENDSKALRGMGRKTDADAVDKRVASIRAATMNPN